MARPVDVCPGIVYSPGPRIQSTARLQVTVGCSVVPSLYVTVIVAGNDTGEPSVTESETCSTDTTSRGATAPVYTYSKVRSDSSGVPSQANSDWLSHAEPPNHSPTCTGSYAAAAEVAHPEPSRSQSTRFASTCEGGPTGSHAGSQ